MKMAVGLYGTTGTWGTLAKASGDLKFLFFPEPSIDWSYQPQVEFEDIPSIFAPYAYHNFTQSRIINLTGILKPTVSADPTGAKNLYERMEDLDKAVGYLSSWSAQPQTPATAEILCLSINPFPGGGSYDKIAFVVPTNLRFNNPPGTKHLDYTLTLREVYDMILF